MQSQEPLLTAGSGVRWGHVLPVRLAVRPCCLYLIWGCRRWERRGPWAPETQVAQHTGQAPLSGAPGRLGPSWLAALGWEQEDLELLYWAPPLDGTFSGSLVSPLSKASPPSGWVKVTQTDGT